MNRIPNGYLIDRCKVWCEPNGEYVASKGWRAEFPDLSTSDAAHWLNLETSLRQLIGSVSEQERIQVLLYTGHNFTKALDHYDQKTEECEIHICREVRKEVSHYFRERMENQTLVNANVEVHVSSKFKAKGSMFEDAFDVTRRNLDERGNYFDMVIRGIGGAAHPLDDQGHYEGLMRHWSPGTPCAWTDDIDLSSCLEDLVRHSDVSPRNGNRETAHGFYLDGKYVGIIVVKKMPRNTWQKTMQTFVGMAIPGLRIVLNMRRLSSIAEELHDDERDHKLSKNSERARVAAGRLKHFNRIVRLQNNEVVPFRAQLIISVYADTPAKLDSRMNAVRVAVEQTGCQGFNPALTPSSVALFNCSTPGYGPWTGYNPYWLKIDDLALAHMCPVGSTPTGKLDQADWLVCGNQKNLVGFPLFIGSQPSDLIVMAQKGAGKSASLQYLILQAAKMFGFLGIIDEGFSWIETAHLLDPGSRPIVVRSNSGHTFNPFDTKGMARSPQHNRSAVSLIQLLAGRSDDKDRDHDQGALISQTVKAIYEREFTYWKVKNPDQYYQACRTATLALRTVGEDFVDAVQWLKELKVRDSGKYLELQGTLSESGAMEIAKDRALEHFISDAAFSMWTPEMFPQLFHLWDELNARSREKNASPLYKPLATRLEQWLRDGEYGPIVDGVSNIDLGTKFITKDSPLKVVHFELGEMGKSEGRLKEVLGFLLADEMRSTVQNMPRAVRKGVIIEEMTSLLRVPNAQEIVIDYSERMRKYNCWLAYVFQQYSGLLKADKAVAEAVVHNSLSMMLLMNKNPEDLIALNDYVKIPEPIRQVVQQFPPPESMRGRKDAYAGCVYVDKSGTKPEFTVCRIMMSERIEEITNSSGDRFDEKRKQLAIA